MPGPMRTLGVLVAGGLTLELRQRLLPLIRTGHVVRANITPEHIQGKNICGRGTNHAMA
jgi:hypothetical protein